MRPCSRYGESISIHTRVEENSETLIRIPIFLHGVNNVFIEEY
jgi:hypothetical protein